MINKMVPIFFATGNLTLNSRNPFELLGCGPLTLAFRSHLSVRGVWRIWMYVWVESWCGFSAGTSFRFKSSGLLPIA
jgi:hypothetical protein